MMEFLSVLWFFLIFVLIAGYFVLDGFDLGIGVLSPFIAKNDEERAVLRRAIGPVWDGNEVWLLTAGGALFAAFAPAYATTFSGFYLAVMLVLFGLIVRAVFLWSSVPAIRPGETLGRVLLCGLRCFRRCCSEAVGNIFAGIPHGRRGRLRRRASDWPHHAFHAADGAFGPGDVFVRRHAGPVRWNAPLPSYLQARAARLRLPLQVIALVLFAVVSVYALVLVGPEMDPNLGILGGRSAALVVVGLLARSSWARRPGRPEGVFWPGSASMIALVALLACSMFPVLVNAITDSVGPAITLANARIVGAVAHLMTIILHRTSARSRVPRGHLLAPSAAA